MFERFTDRARRVVVLAQEEARLLNHNYIGTEHILLGLIHEGEGVAAKALESLGISLEAVRNQVEEIIGQGGSSPSGHIPFTPRAKKVLELSLREALQLGHNYIGTEHILLGLIREGEGVAAQVLVKLGADLSRVRQQVIQLLSGYSGSGSGGEGGASGGSGEKAGATAGGSGGDSQSGSLVLPITCCALGSVIDSIPEKLDTFLFLAIAKHKSFGGQLSTIYDLQPLIASIRSDFFPLGNRCSTAKSALSKFFLK